MCADKTKQRSLLFWNFAKMVPIFTSISSVIQATYMIRGFNFKT